MFYKRSLKIDRYCYYYLKVDFQKVNPFSYILLRMNLWEDKLVVGEEYKNYH